MNAEKANLGKAGLATGETAPTKKQLQTEVAKQKICAAVVACLDEYGYSETTINRVQNAAGVTRGALTHHFPSKEAMMVETVERLLEPARAPVSREALDRLRSGSDNARDQPPRSAEQDILGLWTHVVNTPGGRALVEILVAARTDKTLHLRIAPSLQTYHQDISQGVLALYKSVDRDDDDVAMVWSICRVFLRGLHMQERFETDPQAIARIMRRFAEIVGPHMSVRQD